MFHRSLAAASLAAGLFLSAPVLAADTQDKVSGADVVQVLSMLGHTGQASIDSYGEPQVDVTINGVPLTIFFYSCDKATTPMACQELHLSATYQFSRPVNADMVNKYNATTRYGQAYVDGNVTKVDMALTLKGGVTLDNFKASLEQFFQVMGQFEERVFS